MYFYRTIFVLLLLSLVSIVIPRQVWAEDSFDLAGLGVDNRNDTVSAGFHIQVNNIEQLQQGLESGSVFELTCVGELYEKRAAMWDKLIGTGQYNCTISAIPLARECILEEGGRRHTLSFDSLKTELTKYWSDLSVSFGSWNMIERNNNYHVILKLKIVRKNVPQWVSTTLFFVNWDLLPETVYELEFDY